MIRALVEKELRQHAVTFAFLFALLLVGLAGINGNRILVTSLGTGLAGMCFFLWTIVPLACLMFGHVLIAAEFSQKTQLFLEGLPLPRWRLLAVKYLLGFLVLAAGCAAALTIAFQSEVTTGAITVRFVLIVVSKTVVWLLFVYTLFFTHSLLGRYRFPAVIAVALLVGLLGLIGTRWWRLAPFTLIDLRFPYEAHHYPMTELWITVGASVALLVAGFWLGLARDATLTFSLARKMSTSERSIVTFLTIAAVVSLMFVFKQREEREIVRMPGAVELERGQIRVSASAAVSSPTSAEQAAVQAIVPRVVAELEQVADYLGCKTMPPVFIVHRRDFQPGQFENGALKPQQGLMVRVNLAPESFREKEFIEGIICGCLSLKSSGRAKMEQNAWVLTGFSQWWTLRKEQPNKNVVTISDEDLKRFEQEKIVISEQSLNRWFTLTQKLSDEQRDVLSSFGVNVLESRYGEEACRRFLGAMLSRDLPHDVRGWLFDDVFNPLSRRFRKATGASLQSFASEWDKAIQARKIAKSEEK